MKKVWERHSFTFPPHYSSEYNSVFKWSPLRYVIAREYIKIDLAKTFG